MTKQILHKKRGKFKQTTEDFWGPGYWDLYMEYEMRRTKALALYLEWRAKKSKKPLKILKLKDI